MSILAYLGETEDSKRIKKSAFEQYYSKLEFWQKACFYEGQGCFNPKAKLYEKQCSKLLAAWYKAGSCGKLPTMPPETIECEKCR